MLNLCILNGSPKGNNKSNTDFLIDNFLRLLSDDIKINRYYINNILKNPSLFEEIVQNDSLIIASPLYADSFPSSVLSFLHSFDNFLLSKENINLNVYGIINCGFLEGIQNKTALRILENFCNRTNLNWCHGIGIGGGEALPELGSINSPKGINAQVYKSILSLASSVENKTAIFDSDLFVNPTMPKLLYMLAGNHGWKTRAKKQYNIKSRDLYKKIYK